MARMLSVVLSVIIQSSLINLIPKQTSVSSHLGHLIILLNISLSLNEICNVDLHLEQLRKKLQTFFGSFI